MNDTDMSKVRACSTCGEVLAYEGPADVSRAEADHAGGKLVCPNGHIEAVDPL